ncbi:MAG: DNA-directed RNA polymerase subunit omega [Eubacterium sp.]|nr:DNA-directed RNA polymerase subunit omega [Eubacterium sp.]
MLHPSYTDLMDIANKDVKEGDTPIVQSRYSIVMATSKRARQIVDGRTPMVKAEPKEKALSTAVEELYDGELKIIGEDIVDE